MSTKERLDVALVARGLAETRAKAQASIMSGIVYVNGQKVDKAGTPVAADAVLEVRGHTLRYVSRGGLKLEKAMQTLPSGRIGKTCMAFSSLRPPRLTYFSVLPRTSIFASSPTAKPDLSILRPST